MELFEYNNRAEQCQTCKFNIRTDFTSFFRIINLPVKFAGHPPL